MGRFVGYKDQCEIPTRLTTFAFLLIHTHRSEEALADGADNGELTKKKISNVIFYTAFCYFLSFTEHTSSSAGTKITHTYTNMAASYYCFRDTINAYWLDLLGWPIKSTIARLKFYTLLMLILF